MKSLRNLFWLLSKYTDKKNCIDKENTLDDTEPYFPNRRSNEMSFLRQCNIFSKELCETKRYEFYELISTELSGFVKSEFFSADELVKVIQLDREIYFPTPLPLIKYSHLMCGYEEWLERKYSLPGFVEVEENDIVVDCGGYVGGFSLSAAKKASEVHVFEPDETNFLCCMQNLKNYKNVIINKTGLYNESKTIQFHVSESSVEHSILPPDDGTLLDIKSINVVSLYEYLLNNNLSKIDFLKLEAEGVEPEIFAGLGSYLPQKLAIDVSPEREGESPASYFKELLESKGYKTIQRNMVLFAKL